ncbi:MAG: AAA family ATPase [Anaerolineales bacterium]|nr:AAA family ATPase [Anaerolineales bacterium]
MTKTIALAGKGGTGKTTISAMIIKYLINKGKQPILAIDADPSANLNMVLGVDLDCTVGGIREDLLKQVQGAQNVGGAARGSIAGGMSKHDYLDYEIHSSLIESDNFDLLAMGRSEGPGCYCAVNHNLRDILNKLSDNYPYVVMDNEAGMEHLSRRTTQDVDHLFIISGPTQRGLSAADNIVKLKDELAINVKNSYFILNRVPGEIPAPIQDRIEKIDVPFLGPVPMDQSVVEFDYSGKPLIELEDNSPVYTAVAAMMDKTLGL